MNSSVSKYNLTPDNEIMFFRKGNDHIYINNHIKMIISRRILPLFINNLLKTGTVNKRKT